MNLPFIALYFLSGYLGFTISPARVEKALYGTTEMTDVFEVQNYSNDTLRIKVGFEDFIIDDNGMTIFLPAESLANSVARYTTVNPEEFSIRPQGIENVRITFHVPQGTKTPEFYSMLLFKSQPIPTQYKPTISIAGEIGVPLYYTLADIAKKDAVFESLYVQKDTVNIVFKNQGNAHLRVKGEAKILKTDESVMEKDSIPEFVVFPDRIRKVKLAIKNTLEKGSYIARVRLDYGVLQLMEGERRFNK